MRLGDYVALAFRNLVKQGSRSLLAIVAIVIGTTSVTILLAMVLGAKNFYYDQFESTGQLQQIIVNPQAGLDFEQSQQGSTCADCVKLTEPLAAKIQSYPHVAGLSRTLDVNAFYAAVLNGKDQPANNVEGYQPNGIVRHIFVAGGDFPKDSGTGKIIIGQNYADLWGYRGKYQNIIGKKVSLITNNSFSGEGATLPDPLAQFKQCQISCQPSALASQQHSSTIQATVVGVESDDSTGLYIPLRWAEGLLTSQHYEITAHDQAVYTQAYTVWKYGGQQGAAPTPHFTLLSDSQVAQDGYSTFVVKADNADNVAPLAKNISQLGLGAVTAKSYIRDQLQVFNIVSFILAGIGTIALAVAAIGIVNTMVMAVLERTSEIGVMRAVGARRSTVRRLFTMESSLLGFFGGIAGIVIGFSFVQLANFFVNAQLADNASPNRNIISLPLWLILAVIGATTVIGMLAGLYPAHRAAKLNPVEALRHE